jgi:DNA-binding CsgD family transcriptional regulator
MFALKSPPFAALTDKEHEILRLLAAGHTVKSIAAQLGRSETSINERLRDARRKTGIGSSRELARMLDSQKIWDKKIDLSARSPGLEGLKQPRKAGRIRSKGMIVMFVATAFLAAGIFLAETAPDRTATPPSSHATASQPSPLVGRWSLDVEKVPAQERPRQVTIAFRVSGDQKWTTNVEIIGADGRTMRAESTAAPDGVPVPITGDMGFIDTGSLRQPAPNTLVLTLAKNGTPVSTRVYAVARDLKSMTETIIWAGSAVPKLETNHFSRID